MILFYFIKNFCPSLYNALKYDVYSVHRKVDDKIIISSIKSNTEFRILFYLRAAAYFKERGIIADRIIYRVYLKLSSKYCITIYPETRIGIGFRIAHIGNIIVHSKSIIGDYVTISQGVTIGKIHTGKKAGTPVLGSNIFIGPNAVIVGGIKIGNNVLISGNSFVNFDVPNNSVVIGNPGVIHFKENPTSQIINIFD